MRLYRRTIRALYAAAFIGGGVCHFLLGRLMPDSYAAFAGTALLPWLSDLWRSFVMPNIGWLTIALGLFEIACGAGIPGRGPAAAVRFDRERTRGGGCGRMDGAPSGAPLPCGPGARGDDGPGSAGGRGRP